MNICFPSFRHLHNASYLQHTLPYSFHLKTTNVHPNVGNTESNHHSIIPFSSSCQWQVSALKSAGGDDAVSSPAKSLRRLLEAPGIHLGPACFDALSAKLVERAGFDFCFTTGTLRISFAFFF